MKELRFTDDNFEKEVLNSEIPVLVDFWASWCPPCKMVEPVINELAKELDSRVRVGKINIDQNPKTAAVFNLTGAPAFIIIKNGKEIKREIGARSKEQLKVMLSESGISI